MERLEVFDSNKARVRYIIKQRCEAGEPGIGVWHLIDSLANTGSLPYYWMPLRNPPNDEYSGIVADDERVVCIPYEPLQPCIDSLVFYTIYSRSCGSAI